MSAALLAVAFVFFNVLLIAFSHSITVPPPPTAKSSHRSQTETQPTALSFDQGTAFVNNQPSNSNPSNGKLYSEICPSAVNLCHKNN